MTVASGEAVYCAGDPPSTGLGLEWSGEELDAALHGPVAAVLFDDEGRADIEEIRMACAAFLPIRSESRTGGWKRQSPRPG